MTPQPDILQCPDCKRPDALRIRYEVDPDTAVCGYCGSTVSLTDFALQNRRAAIGTVILGLLFVVAGVATWNYIEGFQLHLEAEAFRAREGKAPSLKDLEQNHTTSIMHLLSVSSLVLGAGVLFVGLRRLFGRKTHRA